MSHEPPLPAAATSPYPLHPAPIEDSGIEEPSDETAETIEPAPPKISNRTLGLAAGAAIGSAAIAAALLFYNRPAAPAKRTPAPKPKVKRPTKPRTATAKPTASKATKSAAKATPKARAKPKPKSNPSA